MVADVPATLLAAAATLTGAEDEFVAVELDDPQAATLIRTAATPAVRPTFRAKARTGDSHDAPCENGGCPDMRQPETRVKTMNGDGGEPKRVRTYCFRTLPRKSRHRSVVGLSRTSAGVPCSTTLPSSMKMTRSATSLAKPISWVTTISVVPVLARSLITASTSPTSSGSRADVGSSKRTSSGSIARALAIATRCCCPPES